MEPTDKLLINSSTFYGNEQPENLPKRHRYFHDFYISYAATDRLSAAGVFDVGKQEQTAHGNRADTWHTAAGFLRYKLADKWAAAARAEYYYADHGVIINSITPSVADVDFNVKSGSFNLDYLPTSNVALQIKGRLFHSGQGFLPERNNQFTNSYGNLTSSIALSF